MTDLHELLNEVETADTVRGSAEKFVDGLASVVRDYDPATADKILALRPSFAMALTTNTSHIAVDANGPARLKALAMAVNTPNVVTAEKVGQLEDALETVTNERNAAALLLEGVSKKRDELQEALKAAQDALFEAQSQVAAMRRAYDEQVARNAATLATVQEHAAQGAAVLEAAKEVNAVAARAAVAAEAAAEAAVKVRETTETVEPAKE